MIQQQLQCVKNGTDFSLGMHASVWKLENVIVKKKNSMPILNDT